MWACGVDWAGPEEYSYTSTHPLGHTGHVTGSLYLYLYVSVIMPVLPMLRKILLGRFGKRQARASSRDTIVPSKSSPIYYSLTLFIRRRIF